MARRLTTQDLEASGGRGMARKGSRVSRGGRGSRTSGAGGATVGGLRRSRRTDSASSAAAAAGSGVNGRGSGRRRQKGLVPKGSTLALFLPPEDAVPQDAYANTPGSRRRLRGRLTPASPGRSRTGASRTGSRASTTALSQEELEASLLRRPEQEVEEDIFRLQADASAVASVLSCVLCCCLCAALTRATTVRLGPQTTRCAMGTCLWP